MSQPTNVLQFKSKVYLKSKKKIYLFNNCRQFFFYKESFFANVTDQINITFQSVLVS